MLDYRRRLRYLVVIPMIATLLLGAVPANRTMAKGIGLRTRDGTW